MWYLRVIGLEGAPDAPDSIVERVIHGGFGSAKRSDSSAWMLSKAVVVTAYIPVRDTELSYLNLLSNLLGNGSSGFRTVRLWVQHWNAGMRKLGNRVPHCAAS